MIPLPVCMAESQQDVCGGGENEDDYWGRGVGIGGEGGGGGGGGGPQGPWLPLIFQ